MNQNEEVPDFLGGLGDMLPADVLKLVNELLEQLHRKDMDHQGSIVLNIYEKGSLHVDHVDTQNFYGDACPKPQKETEKEYTPTLPPSLRTDDAMVLWKKLRMQAMWMPTINRSFPVPKRHCWPMRWRSGWASRRSGRCSRRCGTGRICTMTIIGLWNSNSRWLSKTR